MIHYLDQTFCTKTLCSNSKECFRFVSDEVIDGGIKWMGPDFPIAVQPFTNCPHWNEYKEAPNALI